MEFADRLKELREKSGINQSELARRIGVSRSVISSYEKGLRSKISTPTLQALATALGVTWQELCAGTEFQERVAHALDGRSMLREINGVHSYNGVVIDADQAKDADFQMRSTLNAGVTERMNEDQRRCMQHLSGNVEKLNGRGCEMAATFVSWLADRDEFKADKQE